MNKEEKQRLLDLRYLRMARIWAENSYCQRRNEPYRGSGFKAAFQAEGL